MKNLDNKYFLVESLEESHRVQRFAFQNGYVWLSSGDMIMDYNNIVIKFGSSWGSSVLTTLSIHEVDSAILSRPSEIEELKTENYEIY